MRSAALLVVTTVVTAVVALLGGASTPTAAAAECALPRVSVATTDRYEGSGGGTNEFTFTVRVTASGEDCSMPGSVRYRTRDGSAEAGSDYTAEAGTVSWKSPGSHELVVPVARDDQPEYTEDFSVELSAPWNAVIAGSSATATVFNDDKLIEADFPGVETAIAQGGICWWPDDQVALPLRLNVSPKAPITVRLYAKDGTAVAGKHYDPCGRPSPSPRESRRPSCRSRSSVGRPNPTTACRPAP
ncbi:Calx-beta domain-containing protein [Actinophytocola gossypii]|uniref:Calx-beta domain-containing protein n=1 Tax=Actinophytocola gossypii TaxID=2812003 RepID=A0ABT2J872_9PSEU|nr:Calx-beta domain-containing protein [Actinophytocola gossypii]MCT2584069.1 hypothetical protein [Actinophytocola gossypii]